MKSKLRVEFDFDQSEPYIQLTLDDTCAPNEQADMRDTVLKNFIEKANSNGVKVVWPENVPIGYPQLRVSNSENDLNWAGCNATYGAENDPDGVYLKGESYNLDVATGVNHTVRVRHHVSAVVKPYAKDKVYKDLATFAAIWKVNKV